MADEVKQSPEDAALLQRVLRAMDDNKPYYDAWKKKADHYNALYRSSKDFNKTLQSTTQPRGKDQILTDGQTMFGKELFIPLAYSVIETMLPRLIASHPEMFIGPRDPESTANVDNIKLLVSNLQEQIDYALKLQTIAKDGLILGIGVQKTFWNKKTRDKKLVVRSQNPDTPDLYVQKTEQRVLFDDPDAAAVDPYDFFFDPFASSIGEAEWAVHRTWRSRRYISQKARAGDWRNLDDVKELDGLVDGKKWDEAWQARLRAGGMDSGAPNAVSGGRNPLHEVLEFHDGEQVITVLDRKLVVASGENPNWHGELPFQTFRPTEVTHQIYGIGEIEPIEALQEEMNELRTQRRYNARLVLHKVFAYADGMIDEDDLQFGPGYAIPTNGDPRELLFPIPVGDIPNSGYQEEDRIEANIDRVSGISEALSGGAPGAQTATGAQLGASAATARIENKTYRLELEIVNPGASQFVEMTQQKVTNDPKMVPVDNGPSPGPQPGDNPENPESRWSWIPLGPDEIRGEFSYTTVRGSMGADNVPQDRADAQAILQNFQQNQMVDQRQVVLKALQLMGIKHPESWLSPPEAKIPAEVLDRAREKLVAMGMPEQLAEQTLAEALRDGGGPDLSSGQPPQGADGNPEEGAPPPDPAQSNGGPPPVPAGAPA